MPWLPACAVALVACGPPAADRRSTLRPTVRAQARREILRRGTILVARLDQPLGTDHSQPGDRFTARVVSSVVDERGREVLPEGTRLVGHVSLVEKGFGESPPRLVLAADALRTPCGLRQIAARVTWTESAEGERRPPGEPLKAAAIAGLYFGGRLMGPGGALIGSGVALGGGVAAHTQAQVVDARLYGDARVAVELAAPLYAGDLTDTRPDSPARCRAAGR